MLEKGGNVHGWPMGGFPAPQGPFYCGVGSESVYGRPLAEAHMDACIRVREKGSKQQLQTSLNMYSGVGSKSVCGPPLAEAHINACIRVRCTF